MMETKTPNPIADAQPQPVVQTPQPGTEMNQKPKRPTMMMLVIAGLVLIGVILAVAVLANNSSKKPALTPTVTNTVAAVPAGKVTVTASGFSPAIIKVKKGQAVTWTNQDSQPHQIATDPYPLENGLAGFVEDGPLLKGDSYAFSFNKTGTFTYHDHLNPLVLKGTVIVQ
jgi:plastocyanin